MYKVKREYWQNILVEEEGDSDPSNEIRLENKNRYWIVLKYTKLQTSSITPVLKGPNDEIAITMQAKKALVRAHTFSKLLVS